MKKKFYIFTTIFFAIDLITKLLVMKYIKNLTIIPNFLSFYLLKNDGVAFSLLKGQQILIILISIIALLYINIKIIKNVKTNKEIILLAMIQGGIIGNLYDRIIYHEVIDFISIKIFNYYFPVFNLADVFICIGAFISIILIIKGEKNEVSSRRRKY